MKLEVAFQCGLLTTIRIPSKQYGALQRETRESLGLLAKFVKAPHGATTPDIAQKAIDKLNDRAQKVEE